MRRSLIRTVAATTAIVLIALLVPMAVLVGRFALEDRLARAALEVQATETVVAGKDKGDVAVFLDTANNNDYGGVTTVLYPPTQPAPGGTAIGPTPGEDERVREARRTGQARVDDEKGGAQILVPVQLGGSSAAPEDTPVIRVQVLQSEFIDDVRRSWALLGLLGGALLAGSILVADRLGRSFVQPVLALAVVARRLSGGERPEPSTPGGLAEVDDVASALDGLVGRIDELLALERAEVTDLAHRLRTPVTRLRLGLDSLTIDDEERARFAGYVDAVDRMVDDMIREARRAERSGLGGVTDLREVVRARSEFWAPLAEDQGRALHLELPDGPAPVRASAADLEILLDALLDNVFSYTPEGTALTLRVHPDSPVRLEVCDAGPGFPAGFDPLTRGGSTTGSTGLGLDIVRRTAEASGGGVDLGRSPAGGALVRVTLAPALAP